MPVPSHFCGYAADIIDSGDQVSFVLQDSEGEQYFRVYAYAKYDSKLGLYTDTNEGRAFFVAESERTKEKVTLFDNAIHGYDNMFVNENKPVVRLVSELPFSPCRVMVKVSYEIPYEEEKNSYSFDSDGSCLLAGGRKMPWEQVKTDGYDWITLCYENGDGRWEGFADEELA